MARPALSASHPRRAADAGEVAPEPTFRAPSPSAFELEAHLRAAPEGATCRGLFIADVVHQVSETISSAPARLAEIAGIAERRYVAFLEYPFAEFLKVIAAAARLLYPHRPAGEGLRLVGRRAYDALLGSHAGRVVFGVLGLDAEQVLRHGPKGYRLSLNFGSVRAELLGDRHFRYHYRDMPAALETYQVGVVEGALLHCGVRPEVRISTPSLDAATFDIRWSGRLPR